MESPWDSSYLSPSSFTVPNLKSLLSNILIVCFTEIQMHTSLYGIHLTQPLRFEVSFSSLVVESNCKTFLFTHSQIGNKLMMRVVNWLISNYCKNPGGSRYKQKLIYQKLQQTLWRYKTHSGNNCACLPMLKWLLETMPRDGRAIASPFCSIDLSNAWFRKNFQQINSGSFNMVS